MSIHKTAIVDKRAELADGVSVAPYAVIEADTRIGSGTQVGPHCVIGTYTTIGKDCQIFTGAAVGSITQDKKFKGAKSFLEIGDKNIIREYATINRGTEEGGVTKIGNENLLMAYSHVAHDCTIGDYAIIANCGTLAGHVAIEDRAVIGGLTAVHQFVRIGKLSITGGCSKVVQDIVPFSMADGHPARIYSTNSIGLDRVGVSDEVKSSIKKAFKIIFLMKLNLKNALKKVEEELPPSKELSYLIEFINSSERGISS
ncbi:MAG: acyl-ACP--UDP-N-acetylglucosamine O-acyltransferase [Candidatus Omnitrophica bacterium]|nr:acyl-ACP--UDP-N-acetylglucosamine O-acyltransferase [Candidatus Omnitrophota bacterium]